MIPCALADEVDRTAPRSKYDGRQPVLVTKEVAEIRGVSSTTAYRSILSGLVPSIRIGCSDRRVLASALVRLDGGPAALAEFYDQALARMPDELSVDSVAEFLRISVSTVLLLIKRGDLPSSQARVRGPHTIAKAGLKAFVDRGGV